MSRHDELSDYNIGRMLGEIEAKLDAHTVQDAENFDRLTRQSERIEAILLGNPLPPQYSSSALKKVPTRAEVGGWAAATAAVAVALDHIVTAFIS